MKTHAFPPDSPLHLFTEDEVKTLFAAGHERNLEVDEVVVTEGEPGDSMFFLLDGYVGARLDSGAMQRSYGPGSYFGELSFINPGHRRSTTILATTRARLQVIDQTSVDTLLRTHPRIVFTLLRRACSFLVDAERNLIADLRRRNTELRETLSKLELTRARLTEEELTSRTDFMTGLSNRRGFDEAFPLFVERAKATGSGLCLLAMDLDQFKQVNDSLGHTAGDEVLKRVGAVLRESVRKTDLPCRFGGDEFFILLGEVDEAASRARAESLRAAIAHMPHPGNEAGLRVTATIGGTMYRPGERPQDFMQRADEALYAGKHDGRNRLGWA